MITKFYRGDWTVRISKAEGFLRGPYDGYFREAWRRDPRGAQKLCHQFTLFKDKETDDAIVQLQIFPDGTIHSWAYEPCMVRVNDAKKLIEIGVFRLEGPPWVKANTPRLIRVK